MQKIGYHIFLAQGYDDVFDLFYDKLQDFHRVHVGELLIYSAISIEKDLSVKENVKISDNIDYEYIDQLNKSLKNAKPIIEVELLINADLDSSINFFYVQDEGVEGFYISEISSDMDEPTLTHYQLFKIKSQNLHELNNFWLHELE